VTSIDRTCRRVIVVGLLVVLAASAVSLTAWRAPWTSAAFLSLSLSLATWLVVSSTLWRFRALVDPAATRFGAATRLTLLRGLLVSVAAGFAPVPPAGRVGIVGWLPALLYAAAAIIDRFDGIVARRLGQTTALGARLDEAMDALGLLAAPAVAVAWGRLPPWYLLLGAAYYLFHAAIWLRRRLDLPIHLDKVTRRQSTRIFAGLQMTLVAVALAPLLPLAVTAVAATLLMLPTLIFFARDWFIVIGRLEPPRPPVAALR
jgi:CDP-diacylglycerol--glycerol-3-phosphate 3-phosphatidyltransferase